MKKKASPPLAKLAGRNTGARIETQIHHARPRRPESPPVAIPGRGLKLKFPTHVLAGQNPPRSQYRGDGDSSGHAHHQCFPGRWDDPFARQGHTLRRHRRGAGSESAERYCGRLKSLIIIHRGNRQPPPVTARRTFRLVSSCSFFGQNHRTPVNADTAFHRKSGLVSVYGKQT